MKAYLHSEESSGVAVEYLISKVTLDENGKIVGFTLSQTGAPPYSYIRKDRKDGVIVFSCPSEYGGRIFVKQDEFDKALYEGTWDSKEFEKQPLNHACLDFNEES